MGKKNGNYHLSYWEQSAFFDSIDVALIGSGIVGLSAAISLKEQHPFLKVIVLERGPLPLGASTRNAGFACFGSLTELLDDLKDLEEDQVWNLVEKRWRGLQKLKSKYGSSNIQFQHYGGFELFRHEEESIFLRCLDIMPYFNRQLKPLTGLSATYLPASHRIQEFGFKYIAHLILNQGEGQLNTGLLMQTMLNYARRLGINIYNGVKVASLEPTGQGVEIRTKNEWSIFARKVLVATNGFVRKLLPQLNVVPARNQILLTAPIDNLRIKGTFHYDRGYYYFRNIGNRILLGGGRNLAIKKEKTDEFGTTPLILAALSKILSENILPDQHFEIESIWSGIMGLGTDKAPIVTAVSDHIYAAVKLGGMGVAIGSIIGEEAANLVLQDL